MKTTICKLTLLAVLMLFGSLPALAIIDKIEAYVGSGAPMKDYERDEAIPIPMLRGRFLRIHGGGTDLVKSVSGGGVSCTIGDRKGGIGSYVEMTCVPIESASTSVRTVTLNYPLGSDTFKIQVKTVGTISKIEYEPTFTSASARVSDTGLTSGITGRGGTATPSRIPATNVPQDQEVTLVVTGTKLANVKLISNATAHYSGSVLSGATDSQCKLKITFTTGGKHDIILRDDDIPDTNASSNNLFNYKGASSPLNLQVHVASNGTGGTVYYPPSNPGVSSGNGSTSTFVDVAPRANMLNVFRRNSNFALFNINGVTFATVENRWCQGMSGDQSKNITIPDITWGVTNVGTQDINQPFDIVLRSNGRVLSTQIVTNLNQGVTRDFTFTRERSQVRVRTRTDRQGCFISPSDTEEFYFEDPQFTVEVDSANAVGENQTRRSNNSRNF